jgi:thioredoxin 1
MRKIQILGMGCPKCKTLAAHAEAAVKALGLEARVEKVEKIADIMKFKVMTTPALVVDGQVKSAGKVLSEDEIRKFLLSLLAAAGLMAAQTAAADRPVVRDETNAAPIGTNALSARVDARPRLVDLGADKCVPCKMMAPVLKDLRQTFSNQMEVAFIDVWKSPKAGEKYGIRMIPTQIFFGPDGKELYRHEGFMSRDDILAKWKELGISFEEKGP